MTKVCHITSVHQRYDTRIFHKECASLANAGYDVTLLVADNKPDEVRNGVKITSVYFHPQNRVDRILHSVNAMFGKALEIDAEIYHLHDPELLPLGKKLKKHGKKVIFDSHEDVVADISEKPWIPKILRTPLSLVYGFYAANTLNMFDAIITVTPHVVDKLKKNNQNTIMITNYPILEEKNTYVKEIESRKIFFAGLISELWSHEQILEAIEGIELEYILMGPADDTYLSKLKNCKSWEKVKYFGKVPHETVKQEIKHASIGLSILQKCKNTGGSIGTLGNNKLFEEMYAELPVVCTDFVLWKEIVDKWHCGICVDPTNIEEIKSAIQYLLDNPIETRKMGENGRKAVEKEYNWGTQEPKLLDLYAKLGDRR